MTIRELYYTKSGELNIKGKKLAGIFKNSDIKEKNICIKEINEITFMPQENSKNFKHKTILKTFENEEELDEFLRLEKASSYKYIIYNNSLKLRACDVYSVANYKIN